MDSRQPPIRRDLVAPGLWREDTAAGIAILRIDRPERRNALTHEMTLRLLAAVEEARVDRQVRAIVLHGEGGSFCSGIDRAELDAVRARSEDAPPDRLRQEVRELARRWPLFSFPKPTLAAIEGPAVGLGCELALQCDLRIVSTTGFLLWNFADLGIVPDMGFSSWMLPRMVGVGQALSLLLGGERLVADEARRLGLVHRVVDEGQALPATVQFAERLASLSPTAVRATKELVHRAIDRSPENHLAAHSEALSRCLDGDEDRAGPVP